MERRSVHLRIAGQSYKVVSTASEGDLRRLAQVVDAKIRGLVPNGRAITADVVVLAALSLAHDLEAEKERLRALEHRTRGLLEGSLERIDALLASEESSADSSD
jgi:cell division protein ZapA